MMGLGAAVMIPRRLAGSASIGGGWRVMVCPWPLGAATAAAAAVRPTARPHQPPRWPLGRRWLHATTRVRSHYSVLGLDPFATPKDIKGAYIVRARETHPDVDGGDPLTFDKVVTAYEVPPPRYCIVPPCPRRRCCCSVATVWPRWPLSSVGDRSHALLWLWGSTRRGGSFHPVSVDSDGHGVCR